MYTDDAAREQADTIVSVSMPVWVWLAALSVEGGRVLVG
jgi:hypothetical protein